MLEIRWEGAGFQWRKSDVYGNRREMNVVEDDDEMMTMEKKWMVRIFGMEMHSFWEWELKFKINKCKIRGRRLKIEEWRRKREERRRAAAVRRSSSRKKKQASTLNAYQLPIETKRPAMYRTLTPFSPAFPRLSAFTLGSAWLALRNKPRLFWNVTYFEIWTGP